MIRFRPVADDGGQPPTRREWLRFSTAALWPALGLPRQLAAPSLSTTVPPTPVERSPGFGQARSVIIIFTSGGQSQLDTWDPKPEAPEEVRGAFGTIATAVPGVRVCEHLPHLARLARLYTIVRTMSHDDLDHGSACYLALTGQYHPRKSSNPPPRPEDFPALGAVITRVRPSQRLPYTALHLNGPLLVPREPAPGQFAGLLGRAYQPVEVGNVLEEHRLRPMLRLVGDVPPQRLAQRCELLGRLDPVQAADPQWRRAVELLHSDALAAAFELDREPPATRERYGLYRAGQACLLARRLVEAGVPWITVFFNHNIRGQDVHPDDTDAYGWDTHNDIFEALRHHLLPRFDWSVSALLEDLYQRGLLASTLVVIMGEFGRAPLVAREARFAGSAPGRKHWAACYSVVVAGAGITPGAVDGASDRQAAYPRTPPVSPADVAATLFHALGIPAETHYTDAVGRRFPLTTGQPVLRWFR
ncbi:MAG: DUF1501 domain-containing protein [Gemmataceae bacterium]|nr:DUF1501 domain-containing protein [Gemmataceae bacterium]MCS7270310.1 DUF1501 domain-containing protein [Gemmataceae bacterium]MDW8243178.1 DUF1501 domain-containing protein [Thermogemmata sp.]